MKCLKNLLAKQIHTICTDIYINYDKKISRHLDFEQAQMVRMQREIDKHAFEIKNLKTIIQKLQG